MTTTKPDGPRPDLFDQWWMPLVILIGTAFALGVIGGTCDVATAGVLGAILGAIIVACVAALVPKLRPRDRHRRLP